MIILAATFSLITLLVSSKTSILINALLCVFTILVVGSIIGWYTREDKRIEKIELDKCRKEIKELNTYCEKLRDYNKQLNKIKELTEKLK